MTLYVDVVPGDANGTQCFFIGLDILQAGRRIGVRQHHDFGTDSMHGWDVVKIPRFKVCLEAYFMY
jgi:hypothetical protein